MKNLFTFILSLFFLTSILTYSQTVIDEKFESGQFPPAGWSIDARAANWSAKPSNNAGGAAPEARFSWSPQFNGDSRFISQTIDLTGVQNLAVEFKHSLDHYSGAYNIGIATRSGGGAWTEAWTLRNPPASIPGEVIRVNITNDLNSSDFQICWYFSGSSYNLNYWYIDDIRVYIPYDHDVAPISISVNNQYASGTSFDPKTTIFNLGLNEETFDVTCEIFEAQSSVYSNTQTVTALGAGTEQLVTFDSFTPNTSNELYEIKITSQLTGDMDNQNDSLSKYFDTNTNQRIVLWEEFTSTTCGPCATANPAIDAMLKNYGEEAILAIWYHVWWPSPGNDPYYLANTVDARARATDYYRISAVPDAVVDGYNGPSPGNTPAMTAAVDSRIANYSAFDLSAGFLRIEDDVYLRITCDAVGGVIPGNLSLRVVAIENDLQYNAPNGETSFDYVMRKMYPDANGIPVAIQKGESITEDLICPVSPSWVEQNTDFIILIQNDDTKEVLQVCKAVYDPTLPVELTSFTCTASSKGVSLVWKTASELNNQMFEVQRSIEGSEFRTIGSVQGAGTSTEEQAYSYLDEIQTDSKQQLSYRLKQIDFGGNYSFSDVVEVTFDMPLEYSLLQNYPNPFNPATSIKYEIPEAGNVKLKVYNSLGSEVAYLVNEHQEAGRYSLQFDAKNFSSGIYFYVLEANQFTSVKKMILLK
ncbi:MAG: T9SS type A sorting domain-containing protein [Ignavibacteriae bacterium]|nr:T9SS type A sorting domain-containing protein [Ignavibacteriota bacterium]